MIKIIIQILAGLGIFMVGAKLVTNHISQASTRQLRFIVGKFTGNPLLSAIWGMTFGAIILNTNAITYSVVSMASTGLINNKRAIPFISWSNPGACLIFLVAFLDIHLFFLLLLGLTGFLYAIERPKKFQNLFMILFSFGLIFFGVNYMSEAAAPIREMAWFQTLIEQARHSYIILFVMSVVLSFLLQSIDGFLMLTLAMTKAGIFTVEQAMLIVYACAVGDSMISLVLSFSFKGAARQLAMLQVFFNIIGAFIFIPLFIVEASTGLPLIKKLILTLPLSLEHQMAILIIFFASTVAFLFTLFANPISRVLERLWPPTKEEDESSLKYLQAHSLNEPVSALELIEKEQQRLISLLPRYIEILRSYWESASQKENVNKTHETFKKLSSEIDYYLSELLNKIQDKKYSQQMVNLINKQNLISNLEENLFQLIITVKQSNWSAEMDQIIHSFVEGLDTILLTANDAFNSLQEFDIDLLQTITADRGTLMDTLRDKYLRTQQLLEANEKQVLLFITEQFEKNVWLMRKLAFLIEGKQ